MYVFNLIFLDYHVLLQMLIMNIIKLQNIFLGRLKRISKMTINNATYFNISSNTLSCIIHNAYSTSHTSVAQISALGDQKPMLLNNIMIKWYSSRAQNNFLYMSHPRIASHTILYDRNKCIGSKTYCNNQYYNSVRYLSSTSIDPIAQTQMQFSGIFKTLSESVPVKMMQDSLLWIHDCTGLPWWAVIIFITIMMRTTITLPLFLYQQYIFAKLENLKCEMDEIVKEMKKETNYGIYKYNWDKEYARRLYNYSVKKQWDKLIIRENCHPAKASLLILVQVPLWVSLSMSIRNLCYMLPEQNTGAYATYQEFTTDGFLWITNLTVADPLSILPVAMGLFNLAIVEITCMSKVKELKKWERFLTMFFKIVAIGMIVIAMYVPSCLSLYWTTSSAFGLFQNLILLSPKLRRFARVPVIASESPHPYLLLREKIIAKYRFGKKMEIPPKT